MKPGGSMKYAHETVGCMLVAALSGMIVAAFGCKSSPTSLPSTSGILSGKYFFVARSVQIDGVTIEGEYIGPMIDFPMYSFDSAGGILYGSINFPVADSLIGVYGDGISLSGAAGGGAASGVRGIYDLPWGEDPVVMAVHPDESVSLTRGDSLMVLARGQAWERSTSRLDTAATGIALLTTKECIRNYGFQLKSKIRKWSE